MHDLLTLPAAPPGLFGSGYRGSCPTCGTELLAQTPTVWCPICPSRRPYQHVPCPPPRTDPRHEEYRAVLSMRNALRRIGRAMRARTQWRTLCPQCLHQNRHCTCEAPASVIDWFGDGA